MAAVDTRSPASTSATTARPCATWLLGEVFKLRWRDVEALQTAGRGGPRVTCNGGDISAEKDGNLRVVYARIGRCQGRPAWRGAQAAVARPYPAVTCHVRVNGGSSPQRAATVTRHAQRCR